MPVSSNFTMETYSSSGRESRGRRSSESSTASDATKEAAADPEYIPTRRAGVGPRPAANPMKFVAAGPAPLLRTASEQMLKAEKLRLAAKKAVREEESTAWQNNLDSWKSSRRKRQEDVIERLTEVKKLEEQENGRSSGRRSKTFGEIMQERGSDRPGRRVLQVFTDDDNDISSLLSSAKSPTSSDARSDLGFATSSDTGSEPSDHQEGLEKRGAAQSPSPVVEESNGHDSGTEEYTYDNAIQGYIKFAEKSGSMRSVESTTSETVVRSVSAESTSRQETSLQPVETMETAHIASQVKTGRPSVIMRERKAKVDVHKRRSMFEERTQANEERSVSASQRRINRKSVDLSDGLRHRIASLETMSGAGAEDASWRPPVKGDQFMQKLAMFANLENSREATADRRSLEPITRQKSASDLRSKFEQLAAEEKRSLERRPSGPNSLGRRANGISSLERRKSETNSLERRANTIQRGDSGPSSLEPRSSDIFTHQAASVSVSSDKRVWQNGTEAMNRSERQVVETVERNVVEQTESHSLENVTRSYSEIKAGESTVHTATIEHRVEDFTTNASVTHRTVAEAEIYERIPPVPMNSRLSAEFLLEPKPAPPVPDHVTPEPPASYLAYEEPPAMAPLAPLEPSPAPEPPGSAQELRDWQDPAAVVDQMEAQILKQLEESERTQLGSGDAPVVLDFPLAPTNAAPPSEKPPPPPPVSDEEDKPEMRPTKSTNTLKKDLYRRRSDFLGIQGQQEQEPAAPVTRPPDMETLLRQERALQQQQLQQQERRRQQQVSREEALRKAEEEAELRAEEFRRRAVIEKEQRDRERKAVEQQLAEQEREEQERRDRERAQEQERRAQERAQEHERRAQERARDEERRVQEKAREEERRLQDQERRVQEEQYQLERRAQEQQLAELDWMAGGGTGGPGAAPAPAPAAVEPRWDVEQQEREWRRRKEQLEEDEEADGQERQIMESLELEENWRHQQHAKYQSRLARLAAAAEQNWQRTQEAPVGPSQPADLLSNRQQARSNPNLLEEPTGASLLSSRSYGDLSGPSQTQPAPAAGPLQQSRSHGRLYHQPPPQHDRRSAPVQERMQQQQQQQPPPHPAGNHVQHAQTHPGPVKPHRTAEQDGRIPWTSQVTAPKPAPSPSPPGPMSRNTLNALAAAPRPALRQEWVPRKRADAPRNTQQHWLIQEAEQRRISAQQERSSLQRHQQPPQQLQQPPQQLQQPPQQLQQPPQQLQQPPGGYSSARAPPPLHQKHASPPQHPVPHHPAATVAPPQNQQFAPAPPQQHQYPAYYSQQPIYENTPAQLLHANNQNNYQDISQLSRPSYSTQVYQSAEVSPPRADPASPGGQHPEDRVLSVSGRKKCSHCGDELGRGAAMIIESLRLFYHIQCFKCCVCNVQLGNGSMGADVRVRNNKLHCHDCYSNDEGLKFSKV